MIYGKKAKVYVAGPYTKGDVALNVRAAINMGEHVSQLGAVPFIPHFSHFWHMAIAHPYEFWLDYDNEWLVSCNALTRLPGESSGADKEEALARELGLPVLYTHNDLVKFIQGWNV